MGQTGGSGSETGQPPGEFGLRFTLLSSRQIVETAYQKTKNFDKLSFLYLLTGNVQKLGMMQVIATKRGDNMSRFQNSLYIGDVKSRVAVLRETGQYPLAYYTAKTNGLDDTALDILEEAGMTEDDLPPPPQNSGHSSLAPPKVVFPQAESNWPIKNLGESFFDRALANGGADAIMTGESAPATNGETLDSWANAEETLDGEVPGEDGDEDEGWDLDAEVIAVPEAEEEIVGEDVVAEGGEADFSEGVTSGVNEDEMWIRNSPLAADHAAAGNFESAMQLLNRQVAAVNFAPLKPLFLSAYSASRVSVPANPSLPPLSYHVRRNPDITELREVLPFSPLSFADIKAGELAEANRLFSRGKFAESLAAFRSILQKLLMVVVSDSEEAEEIKEVVVSCKEYIVGLTMETERRKLVAEDPEGSVVRNLELAAYFTHCKLSTAHTQLALRSAMGVFSKAGNASTAAVFARRLVDTNVADAKVLTQVSIRAGLLGQDANGVRPDPSLLLGKRTLGTRMRLPTTTSRPLTSAQPLSHRSTLGRRAYRRLTLAPSTCQSTRGLFVWWMRLRRLGRLGAGCGLVYDDEDG